MASLLPACNSPLNTQTAIKQLLEQQQGVFAVAFKDLQTGNTIFINKHEVFHAASTMKTPVMIEVFKQAAEGKFSMTDSAIIKNTFSSIVDGSPFQLSASDDSEQELYGQVGTKRTIAALVYDMIIVSSNLATNMLIEKVDARNVMHTMRQLGANDIQVLRGVEDSKAYEKGLNNTTTAYDLMLIFEKLAKGEIVSDSTSQAMANILLDQRFNEVIPALLPKDVKVAHKTGNITGVQHDSGIVYLPDGRKYVLVILSKQLSDTATAIKAMAKVSEMIYQYEQQQKQ
ncbi:MAG: serine hydrolase [Chitinophagaceae bacterium]